MTLKGNLRQVAGGKIRSVGSIITCNKVPGVFRDPVTHQQDRIVQPAGVGRNAQKFMNPARQSGFFEKLSECGAFRRLAQFNESAGKTPQPFLRVNASLNQKNPPLVVSYNQACRRDRIFINGIIAMAAEQPVPVFIKFFTQSQAAIRTKQFFLHQVFVYIRYSVFLANQYINLFLNLCSFRMLEPSFPFLFRPP